jgi:hypothetical protein
MKIKLVTAFLLLAMVIILGGCVKQVTKQERFPSMYEEKPASILILPPMNESTAADAKEYYTTTIQEPLSLNGFYTFPVPVTNEILKMEGIYDTEMLYNAPLNKFKEYFGADAVLFTTIKKWDLVYLVLAGSLTVSFDSEIKSTTSNQTLWKYNGTVVVDLSGGGPVADPVSLVLNVVVTAINCAAADYVQYAKIANYQSFAAMPAGKYHPRYLKDQEDIIIDQEPQKEAASN